MMQSGRMRDMLTDAIVKFLFVTTLLSYSALSASEVLAQSSLLEDANSDGEVRILAFGDSITRGVGDFTAKGEFDPETTGLFFPAASQEAGYPLRLEQWLSIPVDNRGVPGETLVNGPAVPRFASIVASTQPDIAIFFEGSNDAIFRQSASSIFYRTQSMVNIARAYGSQPVIATIPMPTRGHSGSAAYVRSFNDAIRRVAQFSSVPLADVNRAYGSTCSYPDCDLFNLPEGLHPNTAGYDVMAEVIAATLVGVDIFAPTGPTDLEDALGLERGTIKTVPATPAPTPSDS